LNYWGKKIYLFIKVMKKIFYYSNYRQFVKDYYVDRKAKNPAFSYRFLSLKAGINSSAFFKYLIENKRNLSKTSVLKTCAALNLKDEEAEYFENLVFFNQAKTIKEKNLFFGRLMEKRNSIDAKKVKESDYEFYGKWYHSVIRELVPFFGFTQDGIAIAKMIFPSIKKEEAKASMNFLLKKGFIKKKKNGKYVQADPIITTGNEIRAHQVINFQMEMLKKALLAFDGVPTGEKLNSSTTFSISEKTFESFIKKVREFRSNLLELARKDKTPQRVFQLNLNLFPLTREYVKRKI